MPRQNTTDYLTSQNEEDEAFRQRANKERTNVYKTTSVEINGRDIEIPIWHPQMTVDQAESAARDRLEVGLSPFASEDELAHEQGPPAQLTPQDLDAQYKAQQQPAVQQVTEQNATRSTYQYPAGDGTYVTLDQHGKPVDSNDPGDLQGREREGGTITPEEMDRLYQARQRENERARAAAMNESGKLSSTGAETFQSKQLWDRIMAGYDRALGPEMLGPDLSKFDDYTLMAQRGGRIPGVGSGDKQPMMGEPGEFVINKYAARAIGYDNLERMNRVAGGGAGMVEPGRTGYQSKKEGKITIYTPGQGRRIEGKYQTSTGAPINPVEKWYPGGPPVTAARGPETPYQKGQTRWIIGPYGYPIQIQYTDVGPMPTNPAGTDVASLNTPFATNAPPMRGVAPPAGGGAAATPRAPGGLPYNYFGMPEPTPGIASPLVPVGPAEGPGQTTTAPADFGRQLLSPPPETPLPTPPPQGGDPFSKLLQQYQNYAPGYITGTPGIADPLNPTTPPPLDPTAFETPTPPPQNIPTPEGMAPWIQQQYLPSSVGANIPTNEGVGAAPVNWFMPSEGMNVPTFETPLPTGIEQFRSPEGANVPTFENPVPTGPAEFRPSEGANIPTDESMTPTGPNEFLPSDAGANIPTDESMTPAEAPDVYTEPSVLPAEPAPEPPPTYQYPAGDGTYSTVGQDGQPVQATPKLSDRPGTLYPDVGPPPLGGFGQPMGYFQPGTAGPGPLPNLYSGGITYNDVLASGVTPSGNWASSVPAPGGLGGIYGQGSYGSMPFWDRLVMRAYLAGRDPSLGFGARSAIGQYAAVSSPGAARAAAPSWATVAPYVAAAPAPLAGRGGAAPSPTLRAPVQGLPYGGGPWTPATAARTTPITRGDIRDANRGIGGPGGRPLSGAP